ncbi:MAG: response regulator [Halobacteriovoraceae bacterium]|nr:response regulator [Halobacteriovoraceae bacterium]
MKLRNIFFPEKFYKMNDADQLLYKLLLIPLLGFLFFISCNLLLLFFSGQIISSGEVKSLLLPTLLISFTLLMLRVTLNVVLVSRFFVFVMCVAIPVRIYFSGGLSSPLTIFFVLHVVYVYVLTGKKTAIFVLIYDLLVLTVLFVFFKEQKAFLSLEGLYLSHILGLTTVVSLFYYTVRSYERRLQSESRIVSKHKNYLDLAALVSETDINGTITYVNNKFCEVSKFSREELIGQNHNIVNSGVHSSAFWKDFWDKINRDKLFKGEVCNRAKDGKLYWVEVTAFPVYDSENEIKGYSAIRVEVTNKKETEKQMLHQSKLASIGEMAAGVGHEINNPLAISIGNLHVLKRLFEKSNFDNVKVRNSIEKIEVAHERVKKIVDGLRTYSRMDGNYDEVVCVQDAIEQTISLILEIYTKDGVEITHDLVTENILIKGALGPFQQILMNLISNAKDATENQVSRAIHITLIKENEKTLKLTVSDNGAGIPEEVRGKILNPFFTTKKIGAGTGIGLGVVCELVKKMNGTVEIDSEVGKGSKFSIIMPIAQGELSERNLSRKESFEIGKLVGRALVVDDEENIRELLRAYLENMGLEVDEADDGLTGLDKVAENKYDYICTDMKMLKMQGDQFITEAKKLPNGNTKYFIITGGVTTNYSDIKNIDLSQLASGYIQKPFTEKSLYKALSESE